MIGKIFLQFDEGKPARLVWNGETPEAHAAPRAAPEPRRAPDANAGERAKRKGERKLDRVANAAGDAKGPEVETTEVTLEKANSVQQKYAAKINEYSTELIKKPNEYAGLRKKLIESIPTDNNERAAVEALLNGLIKIPVHPAEGENPKTLELARKLLKGEEMPAHEALAAAAGVAVSLTEAQYETLANENIIDKTKIKTVADLSKIILEAYTAKNLPVMIAGAQLVETGKLFERYKDGYKKYIENPTDEAKKTFLTSIQDEGERTKVQKAMEDPATNAEKQAVLLFTLDNKKLAPGEIAKNLAEGKLNIREGNIAGELITDKDIAEFEKSDPPRITPEEAKDWRDKLQQVAKDAAPSNLPEKKDWMQQTFETIKKFFEKISALLAKALSGVSNITEGPKFDKSPLGDGKGKFKTGEYTKGQPLIIEANEDAPVSAVHDGKVIDKGDDFVVIQEGEKGPKIRYSNLIPDIAVVKDAPIKAEAVIGTIKDGNGLGFQSFDASGEEQDPTSLLRDFIEKPAPVTPPAAPAGAPAAAPTAEPVAPAGVAVAPGAIGAGKEAELRALDGTPLATQPVDAAAEAETARKALNSQMITNANEAFNHGYNPNTPGNPTLILEAVPFIDGDKITNIKMEISKNQIAIGGKKYNMTLPSGTELQGIIPANEENPQPSFVFTGDKKIPLIEILPRFDELRTSNDDTVHEYTFNSGITLTFNKTS